MVKLTITTLMKTNHLLGKLTNHIIPKFKNTPTHTHRQGKGSPLPSPNSFELVNDLSKAEETNQSFPLEKSKSTKNRGVYFLKKENEIYESSIFYRMNSDVIRYLNQDFIHLFLMNETCISPFSFSIITRKDVLFLQNKIKNHIQEIYNEYYHLYCEERNSQLSCPSLKSLAIDFISRQHVALHPSITADNYILSLYRFLEHITLTSEDSKLYTFGNGGIKEEDLHILSTIQLIAKPKAPKRQLYKSLEVNNLYSLESISKVIAKLVKLKCIIIEGKNIELTLKGKIIHLSEE